MFSVYFARSLKNGKIYVGYSSKTPKERVDEHNKGVNAWTKNNGPFELIYFENFVCKKDAEKRELFFKSGIGKKVKKAIVTALGS